MAGVRDELRKAAESLENSLEYLRLSGVLYALKEASDPCLACPLNRADKTPARGTGRNDARVLIVNGAPSGADGGGGAFQGEDGELLSKMIRAMGGEAGLTGFGENDVYAAFAIRCPSKGAIDQNAVSACRAYLDVEIDKVRPEVIIAFGETALLSLLGSSNVASLRGRFHDYKGIPIMPTYAPAELNRRPELKKGAWDDLKAVARLIKDRRSRNA